MVDIKSKEKRSENMAAIKSKDTTPEVYLRNMLFKQGYRYRKNKAELPGKPDLWLAKYKTAVFVNGCFWHHHQNCKYAYVPKSRQDYWLKKFDNNIQRDLAVKDLLTNQNIKCLVVWECTIRKIKKDESLKANTLDVISDFLRSDQLYKEI